MKLHTGCLFQGLATRHVGNGAGELGVWGNQKNQAGGWFYAD
ncbi:hypothetical protein [Shouchella clausii]|nr:hypothetical protein [Shouchella clausii]